MEYVARIFQYSTVLVIDNHSESLLAHKIMMYIKTEHVINQ